MSGGIEWYGYSCSFRRVDVKALKYIDIVPKAEGVDKIECLYNPEDTMDRSSRCFQTFQQPTIIMVEQARQGYATGMVPGVQVPLATHTSDCDELQHDRLLWGGSDGNTVCDGAPGRRWSSSKRGDKDRWPMFIGLALQCLQVKVWGWSTVQKRCHGNLAWKAVSSH